MKAKKQQKPRSGKPGRDKTGVCTSCCITHNRVPVKALAWRAKLRVSIFASQLQSFLRALDCSVGVSAFGFRVCGCLSMNAGKLFTKDLEICHISIYCV